jgi:hypothetical protein
MVPIMTPAQVAAFKAKLKPLSTQDVKTAVAHIKAELAKPDVQERLKKADAAHPEKNLVKKANSPDIIDVSWALSGSDGPPGTDGLGACGFNVGGVPQCCNLTEAQCKGIPGSTFDSTAQCPESP